MLLVYDCYGNLNENSNLDWSYDMQILFCAPKVST